jgi:hypothetical protein
MTTAQQMIERGAGIGADGRPQSTSDKIPPVEEAKSAPFPLNCLPPLAADMGKAICKVERTPESLTGCCLLGMLSASIGAGLQVRSGPDRFSRGNLFIMASGESASGKSETYRHAAQPFRDFEDEIVEEWQQEKMPRLLAEKELLESEIVALKKGKSSGPVEREETRAELERKRKALLQLESQLQAPILSVEDITSQSLAVRMAARGECLASLSADGGEIINNLLGRYNKLDRTDDGLYVKAWTGDRFLQDRINRPPVKLKRPCLSALWLVQRDKLETVLSERSLAEGGAIPRLLLCHTNSQPRFIEEGGAAIPARVAQGYRDLIWGLLKTFGLASEPKTIEPSPEALQMMNAHYNAIVARWRSGEIRDVGSYALRWTEQAWRIALCLHAGTWRKRAGENKLALETARAAIEIVDWFTDEQLQILSVGREAARRFKKDEVLALLANKPQGVTVRDVQRERIAPSADEARLLLEGMATEGALEREDVTTGGRPLRLYRIARE